MARILVAESEVFFSKWYTFKLRQAGYQVDRAFDGRAALEFLQKERYDAVLSNVLLPYFDGFVLLEKIISTPNASTPFVIVTELRQQEDREKALALGVKGYYIKHEAQIQDILNALESLLQQRA